MSDNDRNASLRRVEDWLRARVPRESHSVEASVQQEEGYVVCRLLNRVNGRRAELSTAGVEAFFLTLDGTYEYRDFEWREEGHSAVLQRLLGLAEAYALGGGREVVNKRLLGGKKSSLIVELGGEAVEFTQSDGG